MRKKQTFLYSPAWGLVGVAERTSTWSPEEDGKRRLDEKFSLNLSVTLQGMKLMNLKQSYKQRCRGLRVQCATPLHYAL